MIASQVMVLAGRQRLPPGIQVSLLKAAFLAPKSIFHCGLGLDAAALSPVTAGKNSVSAKYTTSSVTTVIQCAACSLYHQADATEA